MATLCFWGVRGSISSSPSKYGTNTSCIELRLSDDHSIFFDAGTGIREATVNREFKKITLCLSHFHWDHIQGLPYAAPKNIKEVEWEFLSGFDDMKERLDVLFDPRFHPIGLPDYLGEVAMKTLSVGEAYSVGDLQIRVAPLNHPGTSYAFEVASEKQRLVYATDSDYDPVPEEAQKILREANFCVMDSQFLVGDAIDKAHYGHASFKHAIDVAAKLGIKKVFLFHFDPNYSDEGLFQIETQSRDYIREKYAALDLEVEMSREGQEIPLKF